MENLLNRRGERKHHTNDFPPPIDKETVRNRRVLLFLAGAYIAFGDRFKRTQRSCLGKSQ